MGDVRTPVDHLDEAEQVDRPPSLLLPGRQRVIWTLWLTYGAFYFCRQNLSVAALGLQEPIQDGGLALSKFEVGWILASLKIAYGLGQLLNGQLSERLSPRVMLAIGMFGSAALNVLFGIGASFYFLLFVWATNGFCQSLGWTPCVRVIANWIPIALRGHAIGIIGTGYQITQGLTYIVASKSAEIMGWRGALYVPAALLAAAGLFMLVCLREVPTDDIAEPNGFPKHLRTSIPRMSFLECLYWTLFNPTLWFLGLTLGLLNACRYGYLDWGLTHLIETRKAFLEAEGIESSISISKSGLQYSVIAIGATAGSYLAGWATDRFFGSRRAPVICILMAILGILSIFYRSAVQYDMTMTMLLLVMIGFCIFGPQVLLVGTAPADLAHRGTSAAAAGFVNFMGYMGAAVGDIITGYYALEEHGGWEVAIGIWAGWAFAGAVLAAILWNTTARRIGVLPHAFPKAVGIVAMILASTAVTAVDQPLGVRIVTYAGLASMLGTFAHRWAAAAALVTSAGSLLMVFARYVESKQAVTWDQTAAMVGCGLAIIASLMILVEQKADVCESS